MLIPILLAGGAALAAGREEAPSPPQYTREMWIADSLAVADAVVIGTAKRGSSDDSASIRIEKVLWGTVQPAEAATAELRPPYRCRDGSSGLWILLARPGAYLLMNPDEEAIGTDQWERIRPALTQRNPGDLRQRHENDVRTVEGKCLRDGRAVSWVLTVLGRDDNPSMELAIDGRRVLQRSFDEEGRLAAVFRIDERGDGFVMAVQGGKVWSYGRYRASRRDGIAREFYRHNPEQVREQTTWRDGLRDGLLRRWDEDGRLTAEIRYEEGFIAPVMRCRAAPTTRPVASLYRNENGVFYTAHAKIEGLVKVGMSSEQVMQVLQVDFSEKSGITFPFYTRTRLLHIGFADGKVATIRTGDNSTCFEPPAKRGN